MADIDVSAQQKRELPDPTERVTPVPWFVLATTMALMALGVVYIAFADIDTPAAWGDGRQESELAGPAKSAAGAKVDGAALFASLCVACHQASGMGLPGVFPPLAGSEWVAGKDTTAAAILLHGVTGPVKVKGTTYNGAMPAFKDQLNDAQIAAVLSHIRSQWGNAGAAVTAETVAKVREETKDRTAPFAGDKDLPSHE
ncbi:MAG: cytochrome c [Rubrivivax sp.]|nr:MAG: cytochrome c [Rubrivivax sp.]